MTFSTNKSIEEVKEHIKESLTRLLLYRAGPLERSMQRKSFTGSEQKHFKVQSRTFIHEN